MTTYVGIDGCRAGWVSISAKDGSDPQVDVFQTIEQAWSRFHDSAVILIDIPIGLPSEGGRCCDTEARRLLRQPRGSSVFPVPCREALNAADLSEAGDINERVLGSRLSVFTWAICPKIRQVDDFLASHADAVGRLREGHPEICFWALADGRPMTHAKKTPEGTTERLRVLEEHWKGATEFYRRALGKTRHLDVASDDIVDAMGMYISAACPPDDRRTLPEMVTRDERDLPMEMVHKKTTGSWP